MKNQYFGDINDYRKYGLLRVISSASELRILIAWMITPDDASADGKHTKYLSNPDRWERFDSDLYRHLREIVLNQNERKISHLENTDLLMNTEYFSDEVPDRARHRDAWFAALMQKAKNRDLVFLDPDNGIEIKSKPYGRKNSSKFVYWDEIKSIWDSGKSMLIYQHFIREERDKFIRRIIEELHKTASASLVEVFSTSHVVFLLVLRPDHTNYHSVIVGEVQRRWRGQIHVGANLR